MKIRKPASVSDPGHDATLAEKQALVSQAGSIVDDLHVLLIAEQQFMKSRDSMAVEPLSVEKRNLLAQLESLSGPLRIVLSDSVDDVKHGPVLQSIRALKEQLLQCQELNNDNKIIAAVEIKHSAEALGFLRRLMKMNDVSLYGDTGKLSVSREKRHLGSV